MYLVTGADYYCNLLIDSCQSAGHISPSSFYPEVSQPDASLVMMIQHCEMKTLQNEDFRQQSPLTLPEVLWHNT